MGVHLIGTSWVCISLGVYLIVYTSWGVYLIGVMACTSWPVPHGRVPMACISWACTSWLVPHRCVPHQCVPHRCVRHGRVPHKRASAGGSPQEHAPHCA